MKGQATILLILLLLASCKKKEEEKVPIAQFVADKSEYSSGDMIHLTNTSANAETFRWTLPTGETSRDRDITYMTEASPVAFAAQFKLEVFSKSGNKSDFIVKNFQVKAAYGKVVFYNGDYYSRQFNLSIDGVWKGYYTLQGNQSSVPNCGDSGYPTFELTVGSHVVTGDVSSSPSTPSYFINTIFTITANSCNKVKL